MRLSRRFPLVLLALLAFASGTGAERASARECAPSGLAASALSDAASDLRSAFLAGSGPVLEAAPERSGAPVRVSPRSVRGTPTGSLPCHRAAQGQQTRARALRIAALEFAATISAAATHRRATWSTAPPPPIHV